VERLLAIGLAVFLFQCNPLLIANRLLEGSLSSRRGNQAPPLYSRFLNIILLTVIPEMTALKTRSNS